MNAQSLCHALIGNNERTTINYFLWLKSPKLDEKQMKCNNTHTHKRITSMVAVNKIKRINKIVNDDTQNTNLI